MELGIAEGAESEYAAEGRLLHAHFADKTLDRSGLTDEQREIIERADALQAEVIARIESEAGVSGNSMDWKEHALTFYANDDLAELFDGTPDFRRTYPPAKVQIVIDAKFGRLEVAPAEANYQLAAYAVMGFDEAPCDVNYVAIIQPRAPYGERLTMAVYRREEIESVRAAVVAIDAATNAPDAPLAPGESQCRYCAAALALTCPAQKASVASLATVQRNIGAIVSQMPAEELGKLLDCIKLAKSKPFGQVIENEAKRRCGLGEMPDWRLKPTGSMREIADVKTAFLRFKERWPDVMDLADLFLACMDPKFGELEKLVATLDATGLTVAARKLNEILDGLVTRTEKAPSVVREKEGA